MHFDNFWISIFATVRHRIQCESLTKSYMPTHQLYTKSQKVKNILCLTSCLSQIALHSSLVKLYIVPFKVKHTLCLTFWLSQIALHSLAQHFFGLSCTARNLSFMVPHFQLYFEQVRVWWWSSSQFHLNTRVISPFLIQVSNGDMLILL